MQEFGRPQPVHRSAKARGGSFLFWGIFCLLVSFILAVWVVGKFSMVGFGGG